MEIPELYSLFLTSGITTDTRKIGQGQIFFALKGDNFNGNQFAKQALESGAGYAVIDEAEYKKGERTILVKDVLETLQQLANYHRKQFKIPVIGITGSNGKTTTKELIYNVLSQKYKTHATRGNLNNHIGVPLTLLSMSKNTEIAIIEMGANHQKEIAGLCKIAEPTHGLITSIGKAHIEGFGGMEGVKKGKGELYNYLVERAGIIFINRSVSILKEVYKGPEKLLVTYGDKEDKVNGFVIKSQPFIEGEIYFEGKPEYVNSHLIGEYNFGNALSAAAIGYYFGVTSSQIKDAIASYQPDNNRSQVTEINGNKVILDAYNANPTSVSNALYYFDSLRAENKMVILGDMFELGDDALVEHQAIVDQLKSMKLQKVVLVGGIYGKTTKPAHFLWFKDHKEAKDWLDNEKIKSATILLKGSRGMQLEKIFL